MPRGIYPRRLTPIEVLFERHVEPEPNTGCWLWIGADYGGGYGAFGVGRRVRRAHRVSWEIHRGLIPVGMNINHRCDQRLCVNPDHLWIGTQAENLRDMHAKGRAASPSAVLTPSDVRQIRASDDTGRALARRLGVSEATVSEVRRGKRWRKVA